jgi:hypothetical protein
LDDLLEVIEQQQRMPAAKKGAELVEGVRTAGPARHESLRDCVGNLPGVTERGEVDKIDTVCEGRRYRFGSGNCEAGLPDAARTGQGKETHGRGEQQFDNRSDLALATDERCQVGWESATRYGTECNGHQGSSDAWRPFPLG